MFSIFSYAHTSSSMCEVSYIHLWWYINTTKESEYANFGLLFLLSLAFCSYFFCFSCKSKLFFCFFVPLDDFVRARCQIFAGWLDSRRIWSTKKKEKKKINTAHSSWSGWVALLCNGMISSQVVGGNSLVARATRLSSTINILCQLISIHLHGSVNVQCRTMLFFFTWVVCRSYLWF